MAIDLKSELARLVSLQEHDLRLHSLSEHLTQLPERRKAITVEVDAIQAEIAELTATKAAQEVEKRDLEGEVALATEHLKTFESKLYAIKTNKEYQAALKEIAEIKKSTKEKDDRCLQLMEALDAETQKLTQLSAALADKQIQVAAAVAELDQEASARTEEHRTCETELRAAEALVAPEVMRVYRVVRSKYIDALAPVEGGICGGCRMKVQPQLAIELQRFTKLCQCPSCHRILVVAEKKASTA